ncbi:hypothetical protein D9611_007914 [Ephemerocybe angulata]|uniref:Uncharacterized protein n=1 Tax=Ephemerocybe angulata TaxID=980116 RepID=A0A8H5CGV8_9AGAR|nr:hypothetical protein D9611_007914 [Tulosesus angulatus]
MTTRSLSRMASKALSYNLTRKGQVNAAGISAASKKAVEELLLVDAETHHCYFRSAGLHNHLSHHLLAAYDLGTTPSHLKKIYTTEAGYQRPIILEKKDASIIVNDDNWGQYLGNQSAYGAFFKYFSGKVAELGAGPALEKYVFDPEVNDKGKVMLIRMMSGAVHPFIQIGYGVEFGDDTLVATGLAQAAIHTPTAPEVYDVSFTEDTKPTSSSLSVLEILRKVYDSNTLTPKLPYDPDALFSARIKHFLDPERVAEIRAICAHFHVSGDDISSKVEELIWASTLLMAATGKQGRKPRLDFFLMHLVTSSIFLNPMLEVLQNPVSKANLVKSFLTVVVLLTLARGRPRIEPALLMGYSATARPPLQGLKPSESATGSPLDDADYNPWPAILGDVVFHPDAHVIKTIRTLAYATREYGATPVGGATGALLKNKDEESHKGTKEMDGTIFARAAGLVMDYMGWVAHGQKARPDWDRSALGWDAAWDKDVD